MVLLVYRDDIFREFLLPNEEDADYPLRLEAAEFGFAQDVVLALEVNSRRWRLAAGGAYTMLVNGAYVESRQLAHGDILRMTTLAEERFQIIVVDAGLSLRVFKKYDIAGEGAITIGSEAGSLLRYSFMELVSKRHAAIVVSGGGVHIEDYSANGVFLNGSRIQSGYRPAFGDIINIFGLHIIFLGGVIGVDTRFGALEVQENALRAYVPPAGAAVPADGRQGTLQPEAYFNRSPRNLPTIHSEAVMVEAPPEPKITKKRPVLMTIGPSFTMVIPMMLGSLLAITSARMGGGTTSMFMYTGIITAMGSAVLGVMWAILNMRYSKKDEEAEEQLRFNTYGNYLTDLAADVRRMYDENTAAMRAMYPDAAACCAYDETVPELWNRNTGHWDFLSQRLGMGDTPFQVDIQVPVQRFSLSTDSLKEKPAMIADEFGMLRNVPVGVDLGKKPLLGLVGSKAAGGAKAVAYALAAQIAANCCYTDVKMAFVFSDDMPRGDWDFLRWLPHCWNEDKSARYVARGALEAGDVFYELANIMRQRAENAAGSYSAQPARPRPHYVLFVFDSALLEDELLAKYVYEPREEYGLSTVIVAETYTALPNACEDIIQNDSLFQGMYNAMDSTAKRSPVIFDTVDREDLERLVHSLANIRVKENETNSNIPATLGFLEMYGVGRMEELRVGERWRKNRTYQSMRVPIGQRAGGVDCCLDIHEKYHGPHGLVAGTTGSGKSETLQSYIMSLAVNFSPDDIAFLIIDFKGGGMANLFSGLPHLAGQISNLSGNQVRRAMISIKSENMRRQRVFGEVGVNNINNYTRLYKNGDAPIPIPHLFIIIDEFAELKREEPDFMRELISVAQVGRSLGVHLILATQKPSGTVDDNIWSNTKFRLCLRVQDKQDSNDMLHKPDAAYITQAGRCYLQVGNDEIYELFQSAYSGAVYDEEATEGQGTLATLVTATGKAAIVGSRAARKRKEAARQQWYRAVVDTVRQAAGPGKVMYAMVQDPHTLEQLAADVAARLQQGGLMAEGAGELARLQGFLRLWPEMDADSATVARAMLARAAAERVTPPEMREVTQLDALVAHLQQVAAQSQLGRQTKLWLPPLPEEVTLQQLPGQGEYGFDGKGWKARGGAWTLQTAVGLYDDPENQDQLPLVYNFAQDGHLAVCGGVVSGKSTFLQTLICALALGYTPAQLNLYALDFSSRMLEPFEKLPHMGGVMYEDDGEKLERFFHMLNSMMDERKKLFGGGNYSQYVRAYGVTLPAVVVAIDGFANFKEKTGNRFEETLIRLSREGVGYGMFLAVTAAGFGLAEIQSRIGDNLRTVMALEMADRYKYMETLRTTRLAVLPEAGVRGRGLANVNGAYLEFQTALMCAADDDYARAEKARELCGTMAAAWDGPVARPVPEIPEEPVLSGFAGLEEYRQKAAMADRLPLGYALEDASVFCVDLAASYFYSVVGRPRTGRANTLKVLLHGAAQKPARELCVIEMGGGKLRTAAEACGAEYVATGQELFGYFARLLEVFKARNGIKRGLLEQDMDDAEVFGRMQQEKPIFIFVADMGAFMKAVYQPEEGVGSISGFIENIAEKGALHNIYFFAGVDADAAAELGQWQAYRHFTGYKTGVVLGGNLAGQRIFTFANIPYNEAGKTLPKGVGVTPSPADETLAVKVIIPLAGK